MDFLQATAYIHSTNRFGSVLGLETMGNLMERLGNPQNELKFIHVAGTNGKGSVVSFLTNILIEAGYKTGTYTSPFINKFNERINIDNELIDDGSIAELTEIVKQKCDELVAEGKNHPTEFEIVTAIAFLYFARHKCGVVVLEVGLGGRLDATNIIQKPMISVITTISYDHCDILGDTLEKIASEKAGIIKNNCDCVTFPQEKNVLDIFKDVCEKKNAKLILADLSKLACETEQTLDPEGQTFSFMELENLRIKLLGAHQQKNAALAVVCAKLLNDKGLTITAAQIAAGLFKTKWSGRFEIVHSNPTVIIDGAHNIEGVQALYDNLSKYFPHNKITFIMGVLTDKDYTRMVSVTRPLARVYLAVTPQNPRALRAEKLAEYISGTGAAAIPFKSVDDALAYAVESPETEIVCAFGSLYYIGEIRKIFGLL